MNRGVNGEVRVKNAFLKRNGVIITEFLHSSSVQLTRQLFGNGQNPLLPLQPAVFFRLRLQNTAEFSNPHYFTHAGTNPWRVVNCFRMELETNRIEVGISHRVQSRQHCRRDRQRVDWNDQNLSSLLLG